MGTTLSFEGYSDDYIKVLGRCKSDSSYLTYILFNIYKDSSVGCKKGEGLLCREFPHKVIFL